MNPAVFANNVSLMHRLVKGDVELFRADALLPTWATGGIHRGKQLAPLGTIDPQTGEFRPQCHGNYIVIAPSTVQPQFTPSNEDVVLMGVGALAVYSEPWAKMTLDEDGAEDVIERMLVVVLSDQTLESVSVSKLAMRVTEPPVVDAEPDFPGDLHPVGTRRLDWIYESRVDLKTRQPVM